MEIFNEKENDYVRELSQKVDGSDIFLGISSAFSEGHWINEHGSANGFLNFNADPSERCARMLWDGKWADNACDWSLNFVCESGGGSKRL